MFIMLTKQDIEHLGTLARINISPEEQEGLAKDLDAVLTYVSEVSEVTTEDDVIPRVGDIKNVMRDDTCTFPGGGFTDVILANAPDTEDGYIKVKQIL